MFDAGFERVRGCASIEIMARLHERFLFPVPVQRVIPPEAVRQELASILATPAFRNSPQRSRLLSYVVDCALMGDHENLKEYVIGVEVFGRPESFDPRLDSVVRVHATQLRKKLRAYYEVNGSTSDFRIHDSARVLPGGI